MVQTSTLPEDDLDGNAQDSRDLSQKGYNDTFNAKPLTDEERDSLADIENNYGGDSSTGAGGSLDDATPEERREAIANQEAAGDDASLYSSGDGSGAGSKSKSKLGAKLLAGSKRFGPSGGIAGILIGSFMGSSVILAPGSLLVALEKAITNDSSDSTRTNIVFRRAYVSKLFSADKSKGTSKIEKDLTSMDAGEKVRFEEKGFKITLSDGDTGTIDAMKTPGGDDIKNGEEFDRYSSDTPEGRRATSNVLDTRSAFFNNEAAKTNTERFNTEKSKRIKPSEATDPEERKKAIDASFDENTGLKAEPDENARLKSISEKTTGGDGTTDETPKLTEKAGKITDAISGKAGALSVGTLPISIACASYNVARLTTTTIKAQWIYQLVSFAYPFVRAAAQIEDQGDIEPSVVENLANRLTWFDSKPLLADGQTNPQYEKTAMDSQGLQMAIYGDYTGLSDFSKKFTSWGWEVGISSLAQNYVNTVRKVAGGKDSVRNICSGAKIVQELATVQCVAGPVAALLCVAGALVMPTAAELIAGAAIAELAKPALHFLATVDLSSALQGEGAGDALAAGLGLFLTNSTLGAAMIPAAAGADGLNNIKSFISKTDQSYYQHTTQLTVDEARRNPWDSSNQYSFMGQLSSMLNPYVGKDGTLFSKMMNLSTVVGESLGKMPGTTANALFSQPSNMTLKDALGGDPAANRVAKCKDPDLDTETGIGISCDWSGRPIGYTSTNVLNGLDKIVSGGAGSNDILTSSINTLTAGGKDKAQVDPDTGAIKTDSDFDNYVKYCVKRAGPDNKGMMPLGSSEAAITDDNYDWTDGSNCTPKTEADSKKLDSFATYYQWCYVQYATSKRVNNCVDKTPETSNAAATSSNCGDGTEASIYTCALQFDPYTYQMNAGHPQYGTTSWYQTFKAAPPTDPNALKFDCSSLVMAAVNAAFGHDVPNQSASTTFVSSPLWRKVSDASGKGGQKGDVIVWDGHVEIVGSDDGSGYATFGAHDVEGGPKDISPDHYGYLGQGHSGFQGIYRYIGPGASSGTTSV